MIRQSHTYTYKTRFGPFKIEPSSEDTRRWTLWIGDEFLGSYHSPEAAADDVYMQATGHDEWDMLPVVDEPTDLTKWMKIKNA